jgi:GGDEF domain-containing protein
VSDAQAAEFAYNSTMIRRFGLIYTSFSLVVLVVLTVLVLARVNTARTQNIQEAQASYRRIQNELRTAAANEEALPDVLREYASLVPTTRALVLYNPDRGLRYVWTSRSELLGMPRDELSDFRGFPDYRLDEVGEILIRERVQTDSARATYLDGIYRVLTFADAYPALRDSLIALLAFALLTVLVLLALGRHARSAETQSSPQAPGAAVEPDREHVAPESAPSEAPANVDSEAAEEIVHPNESVTYEEIALEELASDPGDPGTLFNPVTGLSHREHLEKRLGLELERAAYNDQDLTCLLIRFVRLDGADAYVDASQHVLATFQFEDLCFEYDQDSFCVILPNTELPQGLRQAEAFRKKHPYCVIGASARNGRLVEAGRVLTEADRSLTHAANETGGVVGFRPDPRKYRQFVTKQTEPEN